MTNPLKDINELKEKALAKLASADSSASLEVWRVAYIGRKGAVPTLLRGVKDLPEQERGAAGQAANALREELANEYAKRVEELPAQQAQVTTHTAVSNAKGHMHPLTLALRDTQRIFTSMGFTIVEGPDIELAKYNFDDLNIDAEHPSRAETDTFYLKGFPDLVLRTHVSPLQIRGVLDNNLKPPFKIVYYGPSYRDEKEDTTHGALFQQYEFMVVDTVTNLANLKYIITRFYSEFFRKEMEVRFRPSFFPFVKPGLEVDMRDTTTGKGEWLEMAGAGMVHPKVLESINVDPKKYQGIALGGGLDRLVMLRHGIPDIRTMYSGEIRFLKQFS